MVTAQGGNATAERGVGKRKGSPDKCHFIANFIFHIFSKDLKTKFHFKTKKLLLYIVWDLDRYI